MMTLLLNLGFLAFIALCCAWRVFKVCKPRPHFPGYYGGSQYSAVTYPICRHEARIAALESALREIADFAEQFIGDDEDGDERMYKVHQIADNAIPYTVETGAKHTTEEDFQHFLSYSGLGSVASETQAIQNDLRKAFYAGAGVDLPKKTEGDV